MLPAVQVWPTCVQPIHVCAACGAGVAHLRAVADNLEHEVDTVSRLLVRLLHVRDKKAGKLLRQYEKLTAILKNFAEKNGECTHCGLRTVQLKSREKLCHTTQGKAYAICTSCNTRSLHVHSCVCTQCVDLPGHAELRFSLHRPESEEEHVKVGCCYHGYSCCRNRTCPTSVLRQ